MILELQTGDDNLGIIIDVIRDIAEINGNVHNLGEVTGQTTEAVNQSAALCGAVLEWRQLQRPACRFMA